MKSNQKHPRYKKGLPRTKTSLAEKDVRSTGRPMPPGFDRFESFGHNELTAKLVISGAQGILMLMGSKFFDKDDQAAKHCFYLNVLRPGGLYQNFDPINIRRP